MGPGQGSGNDGFLYYAMYCTHYTMDRDGEPLFSIVPNPVTVPALCSVYEPYESLQLFVKQLFDGNSKPHLCDTFGGRT